MPQGKLKRLKFMLPMAGVNLLSDCCDIFRDYCAFDYLYTKLELSATSTRSIEERMNNNRSREVTICFEISDNGHYHIALRVHGFKDYICHWIGVVCNQYILLFGSSAAPFCNHKSATHVSYSFRKALRRR